MADIFDNIDDIMEREIRRWLRLTRRLEERLRKRYGKFIEEFNIPLKYEVPLYDLVDEGDKYVLEVELPGVDRKDIDLYVKDNKLYISAKRKTQTSEKKEGVVRMERSYLGFRRVIELPEDADTDNIKAKYKDGILKVEIPKKPEKLGKKVNVEE